MDFRRSSTFMSIAIVALTLVVAGGGLFIAGGSGTHEVRNQFGEAVILYGTGIYSRDSLLKAPIFKGTDLVMLLFVVPLTLAVTFAPKGFGAANRALMLSSLYGVFLYYSAGLAFGAAFNSLFFAYVALFSVSLFSLVISVSSPDLSKLGEVFKHRLPYRGFTAFLALSGAALILAWMPDIIPAVASGSSLKLIEVYTTEATYVLDIGIIGPSAIAAIYLLRQRRPAGILVLSMLLALCFIVGLMMPSQTLFQLAAGIVNPLPVMLTKMLSFLLLAAYALWLIIKLSAVVRATGKN